MGSEWMKAMGALMSCILAPMKECAVHGQDTGEKSERRGDALSSASRKADCGV